MATRLPFHEVFLILRDVFKHGSIGSQRNSEFYATTATVVSCVGAWIGVWVMSSHQSDLEKRIDQLQKIKGLDAKKKHLEAENNKTSSSRSKAMDYGALVLAGASLFFATYIAGYARGYRLQKRKWELAKAVEALEAGTGVAATTESSGTGVQAATRVLGQIKPQQTMPHHQFNKVPQFQQAVAATPAVNSSTAAAALPKEMQTAGSSGSLISKVQSVFRKRTMLDRSKQAATISRSSPLATASLPKPSATTPEDGSTTSSFKTFGDISIK